jgi:hypothetical protein
MVWPRDRRSERAHAFLLQSTAGVRLFGGGYLAANDPPLQRRIMLAGADPYQTFTNPLLLRSRARPGSP